MPRDVKRLRHLADVAAAEKQITDSVLQAMAAYLELARAAVLGDTGRPGPLTAASTPRGGGPPDLDAWPDNHSWLDLLRTHLLDKLVAWFQKAFRGVAGSASDQLWRETYVQQVTDRLTSKWPAGVFEEVRRELEEATQLGETIRQIRDRIAAVLRIDAVSRAIRDRAAVLRAIRDNPATPPDDRRAAVVELRDLYAELGPADRQWQPDATRIARTEVIGAMNGGTWAGADAMEQLTGDSMIKSWLATHDDRTRPTHREADGQTRPLREPFDVGGASLMFPADPTGPAGEVISCRCTLTIEPA